MGVTQLWSLFRRECPEAFSDGVSLKDVVHGRTIAVDLSMWLHEFGRMSAKSVMLDQNFTKVIEHCVHNANVLRFMVCNVIFVADNREKAALGKEWTNDKRKALATKAWEKYLASLS